MLSQQNFKIVASLKKSPFSEKTQFPELKNWEKRKFIGRKVEISRNLFK